MILEGTRFPVGRWCVSDRCAVDVVWAITGKTEMLVDAIPTADGTVQLVDTGQDRPLARTLTVVERATKMPGTLHRSHFATCPDAQRFRRART